MPSTPIAMAAPVSCEALPELEVVADRESAEPVPDGVVEPDCVVVAAPESPLVVEAVEFPELVAAGT